jgi:hypothetical protein
VGPISVQTAGDTSDGSLVRAIRKVSIIVEVTLCSEQTAGVYKRTEIMCSSGMSNPKLAKAQASELQWLRRPCLQHLKISTSKQLKIN